VSLTESKAYESILKRIRDIPSLPEVVNQVIPLMAQPNVPASKIAELISYDPGLTTKVLRMVNSAAYGFQRQISSVQHGIMILGFNTVRGIVLSASIFKLFEGTESKNGIDHQEFWQHSMATAIIAQALAKERSQALGVIDLDDAFSAGMLHDIGKIVLDVYFGRYYQEVLEWARANKRPYFGQGFVMVEQSVLGTDHMEIGAYLANKWKLPVTITSVIEYHHKPQEAQEAQKLVHIVALANKMARIHFVNHGVIQPEHFDEDLLAFLKLDIDKVTTIQRSLKDDLDGIASLLASLGDTTTPATSIR